ncbi:thiamine phosphate synthase [Leuconostoc gasicomitatum]|uniref:thiamine phosphate synthase n=1 Tax=Leuconostoc gasicomitatum TaxID=115778 RepID=UPI001CC5A66D|nr:thiamine phosphate synthase [Leuconostoc gasicomitatum]MBZ5961510.1 thiamine phosphate synthase [Leuconostoc gasicomitatum]MBZ5970516.1 thiamine phosphate synthase [Leuconostoc gasicomitatum]MBZ5993864.1 thiamine phosphate synthase [Leuconostoc gasicomitatum]MBZ5997232.1 thiamine phosphate synthase [Leuconostoc gasicomitatum]
MIFNRAMLARYFILGTQNVTDERMFYKVLEEALSNGITLFQYREKGFGSLVGANKLRVAQRVRELTSAYHVPFVIDDDIVLAHIVHADGVHFGQGDGNIAANIVASHGMFVGVSVSSQAEYERISLLSGIDNIGIGPVFETKSKADAKPAIGLIALERLVEQSRWPTVAIGGISQDNLATVLATDVDGAAVISMISDSSNIENVLKYWQQL